MHRATCRRSAPQCCPVGTGVPPLTSTGGARLQHPLASCGWRLHCRPSPCRDWGTVGVLRTHFPQTPFLLHGSPSPAGTWVPNHRLGARLSPQRSSRGHRPSPRAAQAVPGGISHPPFLHTGGLEGLSPGHPAGLVLDPLQIRHRDMFLKAHSRLYPQQLATIRRVKPKASQGTFPTAATAHGGGSSGTHSDPAASCLASAGVGLVGGTSSVSSSPKMKPSGFGSCFVSSSKAKSIQLLVRLYLLGVSHTREEAAGKAGGFQLQPAPTGPAKPGRMVAGARTAETGRLRLF